MDTPTCRRRRDAFTLVEMLMVITIIGILAGLLLVAVRGVQKAARGTATKTEISQLDMALENYRTEYGEFPPDFVGVNSTVAADKTAARNVVLRHLRKRFPRYTIPHTTSGDQFDDFVAQVQSAVSVNIANISPDQALVFWIGGLPVSGSNELTGFSANPQNPIQSASTTTSRTKKLFDFPVARLIVGSNGLLSYGSATSQGGNFLIPVAYFMPVGDPSSSSNWYVKALTGPPVAGVWPYADSQTITRWVNSGKPQLISAGLDGEFGTTSSGAPLYPSGANLSTEHMDNVTNFTGESTTIKDGIQP